MRNLSVKPLLGTEATVLSFGVKAAFLFCVRGWPSCGPLHVGKYSKKGNLLPGAGKEEEFPSGLIGLPKGD